MRWTPFSKPLGDLDQADIEGVVEEGHSEGLFLEFKEEWTGRGIARAVASFANMPDGGTVIVGIREDPHEKLRAGQAVGFEHPTDPTESADRSIRMGVAPLPLVVMKSIRRKEDGRWYLVVEVPPGLEPPYVHLRSGSVLIRTATGSEPAHREELDRLYGQGLRGREWANNEADQMLGPVLSPQVMMLTTIPTVENGLPRTSRILSRSFYQAVPNYLEEPIQEDFRNFDLGHGATSISVSRSSSDYSASLSVDVGGTIRTVWQGLESQLNLSFATFMIERVLPRHQALLDGEFGHRGSVVVAMGASGIGPGHTSIRLKRLCQVDDLDKDDFHRSLVSEIKRGSGAIAFEPE